MKKRYLALGAIAALVATLGALWSSRRSGPAAGSSAVVELLSQSLKDADGRPQALAQWKNKALVVNFWATWCAPCVQEMPALSALQPEAAARNIQIIGIGIDSAENIAEFGRKYKITYPLYTGGLDATELSRKFGDTEGGLPFTVLVGRDGRVMKTYLGRLKMDELRKDLAGL